MDWRPTARAIDVMRRRGITWADVISVLRRPEVTYRSTRNGRDNVIHQRGNLAVVTGQSDVVTVLLRSERRWDDGDAKARAS